MTDTIFALSSGPPPAGIAVVRISGPQAGPALEALTGKRPAPRHASYCRFVDAAGAPLDDGLALWFPGPGTATGEDLAELHLHGGRAVVAAVLASLGRLEGLRPAQAGEFTRRAFENGRIDLAEAEGLADLLAAETEGQRQSALALAEGGLGRRVAAWQAQLLRASALIEATLDFSDEGDVPPTHEIDTVATLSAEIAALLLSPPAERLRDGVRVVLAGPPNSGKSSLFNILAGRDAAIVTDIAGTTRDRIEAPVVMDGAPLLLIDTAGLRAAGADAVEAMGIALTGQALAEADIILWLGDAASCPEAALLIAPKADLGTGAPGLAVSTLTGEGLATLRLEIVTRARMCLPKAGSLAINARHRAILADVAQELASAQAGADLLITAEHLRQARTRLDALTGRAGVEDMLDALFGAFCIGK
jgi:tRNA modification GTPase